jgi:hypothetical protein
MSATPQKTARIPQEAANTARHHVAPLHSAAAPQMAANRTSDAMMRFLLIAALFLFAKRTAACGRAA